MNRQEHLLTCLAEECAEVAQRVSKALRFSLAEVQPGQPDSNAKRIAAELKDLISVVDMLEAEAVLQDCYPTLEERAKKVRKIEGFMEFAKFQGALT
ncbi:hypothetical protein [Kaistia sp. MMO-174]|uniref:hypothetical protein n=1 Tax=Kaistia sp. MMO-174 TaxID=3081256 RepID=UPI00301725D9